MNIVMNVNPNRCHNIVGSCYKWNKYVSQQEVVKDISSLMMRGRHRLSEVGLVPGDVGSVETGEQGGPETSGNCVGSLQYRVLGQVVDESHSRIECQSELRISLLTCHLCCGYSGEFSAGETPASCTPSSPSDS